MVFHYTLSYRELYIPAIFQNPLGHASEFCSRVIVAFIAWLDRLWLGIRGTHWIWGEMIRVGEDRHEEIPMHPSPPPKLRHRISPSLGWYVRKEFTLHLRLARNSVQFSSVTQSCPTLCNPMDWSMPVLPVHHQLLELTQTHVHWVSDVTQPSHPLSSPSPLSFNLSQHQGLFKWVSTSHQVAKVLEFQLQHQSSQWTFRTDFL